MFKLAANRHLMNLASFVIKIYVGERKNTNLGLKTGFLFHEVWLGSITLDKNPNRVYTEMFIKNE